MSADSVRRQIHPVDQLVEDINGADFATLVQSGTPQLKDLMDAATSLFEQYHWGDQALAFALMFGMLCATLQGEVMEMERDHNILLSFEDRLRVFTATANVAYRDAMKARAEFPESGQQRPM